MGWYPKRELYFSDLAPERPIFQGDIFRGVPTAFLGHPAAREAAFATEPAPSPEHAERPLSPEDVLDATTIFGSYAMLLPHPCDFSEGEKGSSHSIRQAARLERIRDHQFGRKEIEAARVHHSVWVPSWDSDDPADDWFVDLRTSSSVDAVYPNPSRRVAVLSPPAWMALLRRLINFYTRTAIDLALLAHEAHQHPDYTTEHLRRRGLAPPE
jgi:hypothetical protein